MIRNHQLINNILTIYIDGRLDTSNYKLAEQSIENIISTHNEFEELVFDMTNLIYISSIGLRLVLKYKQDYPNFKIINVNKDVYDIFDMTGFTTIMDIHKQLRIISIEGCPIIGNGNNGRVYRISPDTIVKSFYKSDDINDIERERDLAKTAFVSGINTAISYDVVKIKEEKYGAVYELVNTALFKDVILNDMANFDKYMAIYASFMNKLASVSDDSDKIPSIKKDLLRRLNKIKTHFNENDFNKLSTLINDFPDENHLIHGDAHVKNLFYDNGELLLIDMDTLSKGHPIYDLAALYRTYVAYEEIDPGNLEKFLGISPDITKKIFYTLLDKLDIKDKDSALKKARILAYLMLLSRYTTLTPPLGSIEYLKKNIIELIYQVDNLYY